MNRSGLDKIPTWAMTNSFIPSTVMPRLMTPLTVGNLGSSLASTTHEIQSRNILQQLEVYSDGSKLSPQH